MRNLAILVLIFFLCSFIPNSISQTYCTANPQNNTWERISSVTFNPLDYVLGQNLTITVNVEILKNSTYNDYEYVNVWFDWNNNYRWHNNERLDLGRIWVNNNEQGRIITFTGTVVVPTTASPVSTNVRVNLQFSNDPPACGTWTYGDTQDLVVYAAGAGLPSLTNVSMPTPVDPTVAYRLQFTLDDRDTLNDISFIQVRMFCCTSVPASRSERNYYTFRWVPENPSTWTSDPSGFYEPATSSLPGDTTQRSFSFALGFRFSAVALPTGSVNDWTVEIEVEDKGQHIARESRAFDVNKFLSYTIPSEVNLGAAEPGQNLPGGSINILVVSNTQIDILVQGSIADTDGNGIPDGDLSSFIAGMEWSVIPMANFFASGGSTFPISSSEQTAYASVFQIPDNLSSGITGYSRNLSLGLSFGGRIPDGTPEGTYTGIWIVTVTNRNVLPS